MLDLGVSSASLREGKRTLQKIGTLGILKKKDTSRESHTGHFSMDREALLFTIGTFLPTS